MLGSIDPTSPPEVVAHIIQVALAPVFLLTGIATLLNVFSNRLARVADRVDQLTSLIEDADKPKAMSLAAQLARLRRRSVALDVAVVLSALGAAAICASVLTLLIGALQNATVASVLFTTFALAVLCTLGAIAAFAAEMLMTSGGFRAEVAGKRRSQT